MGAAPVLILMVALQAPAVPPAPPARFTACGEKARGGTSTIRAGSRTVAVTEIDLGRSLNSDLTINDGTDTFRPTDVIYASIETKGPARRHSPCGGQTRTIV